MVAPKNGKCDFPTLQGTPFLLSPDIQQANRASMVLQRNNQDQTCSCHFSNSLANPGSREIRKILLSFLNYQQIEIQLTMTVSTRPLVTFPLRFTTEAMGVISAPCSLKQGSPWQDAVGVAAGTPHISLSVAACCSKHLFYFSYTTGVKPLS